MELLSSRHARERVSQSSVRARTQVLSSLIKGLYDPCKVGSLVDPPRGESSIIARAFDIRGRSVVRVHGSAGVQSSSLYEVAKMLQAEQSRKGLFVEDGKFFFELGSCLADPFNNSFG